MNIKENIEIINQKLDNVCKRNGRSRDEIKLLAVTKTRSAAEIDLALKAGISYIGENKIQEAELKISQILQPYKEFHFIGHLQSNKIRKLLALEPDLIHSLDSFSTIRKLNSQLENLNRIQDILIQVNTSGETSKFGIEPDNAVSFIKSLQPFEAVKVKGLMTIGKFTDDIDLIRACFRKLSRTFTEIRELDLDFVDMEFLSMGMTNDFEIAIDEGANIVRIGSAIFGPRIY